MIELGARENGYTVRLVGEIPLDETQEFGLELQDELAGIDRPFVLLLDAQALVHFEPEASVCFEEALEEACSLPLQRLAVLTVSTAHALPFYQMAGRLGLSDRYLFLDLSASPDWEAELEEWLGAAVPA